MGETQIDRERLRSRPTATHSGDADARRDSTARDWRGLGLTRAPRPTFAYREGQGPRARRGAARRRRDRYTVQSKLFSMLRDEMRVTSGHFVDVILCIIFDLASMKNAEYEV